MQKPAPASKEPKSCDFYPVIVLPLPVANRVHVIFACGKLMYFYGDRNQAFLWTKMDQFGLLDCIICRQIPLYVTALYFLLFF